MMLMMMIIMLTLIMFITDSVGDGNYDNNDNARLERSFFKTLLSDQVTILVAQNISVIYHHLETGERNSINCECFKRSRLHSSRF